MTTINAIRIDFIKHNSQAYPTVGNYFIDDNGVLNIQVSRMNNRAFECLVAIHEFVEWLVTDLKGIPEQKITEFDMKFEKEREEGLHAADDEPGFAPDSPYMDAHTLATGIEMMICAFTGISFSEYDKTVMSL